MPRISKTNAIKLVEKSAGKFITVTFTKKDGTERTMNGKYMGKTTKTGYLQIKERGLPGVKNVNTQTLSAVRANKVTHKVS